MKVPFIDLGRAFKKHRKEYMDIAESAWENGMIVGGKYVEEFENNISSMCMRKYGIAVASCTDALYFSLLANNIGVGDEVIVTSHSFVASASCILKVGATPVFMDIELDTFMIDPDNIKEYITDHTKAIIAVHLYGQSLPIQKIENIAAAHSLILIEDAAQSLGAMYDNRPVGSMGDISCISFDSLKTLGSFGNGGMLLTDDDTSVDILKSLGNHGKIPNNNNEKHHYVGGRSVMTSAEAGMLNRRLVDFGSDVIDRTRIANIYNDGLSNIKSIITPQSNKGSHTWHKYVIMVEELEELNSFLLLNDIGTRTWHTPLYREPIFDRFIKSVCPNAELISTRILGLPIFAEMTKNEAEYVVEIISEFYH